MNGLNSYKFVVGALTMKMVVLIFTVLPTLGQNAAAMKEFMTKLDPEYISDIAGNNEELQKLLLQTFEADWVKAKECLLFDKWPVNAPKPSHDAGLRLMEELVKMRSVVCNGIAMETQRAIPQHLKSMSLANSNPIAQEGMAIAFATEAKNVIDGETHFNPLAPTGAEKRTSDIDVASNGLNTEIGVQMFNKMFREKMLVDWDPATVFDYNIYAADWIFPARFIEAQKNGATEITPRPEHVLELDAGASPSKDVRLQAERALIFEKAGLLHIRRNCTENEWKKYSADRQIKEGTEVGEKLQAVNNQFNAFNAEIKLKRNEIIKFIRKPESAWSDHYFDEALETRARNAIYELRLLKVKALRLHYRVLKEKEPKRNIEQMYTLAKQITEALTEAIFFANEVYATEGATLHATQAIQKVAKAEKEGKTLRVNLSTDQYWQAFHENVGDSLHSLNHYKSDPPYAAYRAGKYIERMLIAAEVLAASKGAGDLITRHTKYNELRELGDKASAVKNSDAGDDPIKIKAIFEEFKAAEIDNLRAAVLEIGGFLPGNLPSDR